MESDIVINTDRDMMSLEIVADTAMAIHMGITIDAEIDSYKDFITRQRQTHKDGYL